MLVVGFLVGDAERGRIVGDAVCTRVGRPVVGRNVGLLVVGRSTGADVVDGRREGAEDGCEGVGRADGAAVGFVGELVTGLCVGAAVVGLCVGTSVVGCVTGAVDGNDVGSEGAMEGK